MVDTMQALTSICALIAVAGAALLLAARALAPRWQLAARAGAAVAARQMWLTLVVAAGATLGSLYFSEVAKYLPCRLCWFQRVLMYPLALIALVALVRGDREARWYLVPLSVIGAGVSTWHYLIEWYPRLESDSCGLFGPACAYLWFRRFGFVTLPFMALCGFIAIIVFNTVRFAPYDEPPIKEAAA